MDTIPVFRLDAVLKQDLPSHTPVINSDEFEYYTWIKLPEGFGHFYEVFQIDEMVEPVEEFNMHDFCWHQFNRPWYRLISEKLNRHVGLHVYRMSLVHKFTNDVISLFFGYVVQCDHPQKPYKYMERDGKCGVCENIN